MASEIISVVANLALTLSFIVAVIFGIVQVRSAARDRKERFTISVLQDFQTREFAELMYSLIVLKIPSTLEDLRQLAPQEQIKFIQFTQQMESLGLLVAEGFINVDLVDKTLGTFVTDSWRKFKPVIQDMRPKTSDPYLSEYFQWLAERIEERMRTDSRRPFFDSGHATEKGR